jgi:hypothetical protein
VVPLQSTSASIAYQGRRASRLPLATLFHHFVAQLLRSENRLFLRATTAAPGHFAARSSVERENVTRTQPNRLAPLPYLPRSSFEAFRYLAAFGFASFHLGSTGLSAIMTSPNATHRRTFAIFA